MELRAREKLLNMIRDLDSVQLEKLIKFTDDLKKQTTKPFPAKALIDAIHGKYKAHLSSSDDFARRKSSYFEKPNEQSTPSKYFQRIANWVSRIS